MSNMKNDSDKEIEKARDLALNNAASVAEILNLEAGSKKGKKSTSEKKTQYPLMLKKLDHALFKKYAAFKNISFNQYCLDALTFYSDKIAEDLKEEVVKDEEHLKSMLKITIEGLKATKSCDDKQGLDDLLRMMDDVVFSTESISIDKDSPEVD